MWGETGNLSNHQNSTANFHIRCLGCGWLRCVQEHACVPRSAFRQLTVSSPSEPNFAVSGCSGDTNTHGAQQSFLLKLTETLDDCGKVPLPASTPPYYVCPLLLHLVSGMSGGWGQGAVVGDTSSPN